MDSFESYAARRLDALHARMDGDNLIVLVWGPGPSDKNYKKRQDIRSELQKSFPAAEIYFSEDPALRKLTRKAYPDVVDEEKAHGLVADLVLALDTSKGVGEEIAKFSAIPKIAAKLIVLSNKRYRSVRTFPAEVRKRVRHVQWYDEDDFSSCRLAKQMCVNHVRGILLDRMGQLTF